MIWQGKWGLEVEIHAIWSPWKAAFMLLENHEYMQF